MPFAIHSAEPLTYDKLTIALSGIAGKNDVDPNDKNVAMAIAAAVGIAKTFDQPVVVSLYGQEGKICVHVDVYVPPEK